jgi:hypothetical protein
MNKKDIPRFVRRAYEEARRFNRELAEAYEERLRFYVGGDLQWRDEEITKRRYQGRPIITINKCKPAVDQIEGDIRMNPPGPKVLPVGGLATTETADIIEGLIREVEYRSNAKTAYSTAGKYQSAAGFGVLELGTEYVSDYSFDQQLVISSVEDPATVFFDPSAKMPNREDAMWAGKIRTYSREEYLAVFGDSKVLKWGGAGAVYGWMQEFVGLQGDLAEINDWTGAGRGPYFVCEFYLVELEKTKLRVYTDNIPRLDSELEENPVPRGVRAVETEPPRVVHQRKIMKYVVDALEIKAETEWLGSLIPLIPVLGPEIYIKGKLHRLSLISGAMDANRGLNYAATTATELVGLMPKAPWIGYRGQFQDERWQTANSEQWAYLEIEPSFGVDPVTQTSQLLPPPQRNTWETPIQYLLQLAAYFSDSIKAVTAIYDPSLGATKGDQSGVAIQQLRSESSVGNFNYPDNLHRAIGVLYQQMTEIFPLIMTGPQVRTIVKPDGEHEMLTINQEFPNKIDPANQRPAKGRHLGLGRYATRVTVGPNPETRARETAGILNDFIKVAPQVLTVPGVAAKFLRALADGDPQIDGIADLLEPAGPGGEMNPAQIQQQLQQAMQQNQLLTQQVKQLTMALQAKLPQIEADKWKTAINALAGIREAEIKAGVDKADRDAGTLEHLTGLAHETAMQAVEHQQQASMQSQQSAQEAAQTQPEQE